MSIAILSKESLIVYLDKTLVNILGNGVWEKSALVSQLFFFKKCFADLKNSSTFLEQLCAFQDNSSSEAIYAHIFLCVISYILVFFFIFACVEVEILQSKVSYISK